MYTRTNSSRVLIDHLNGRDADAFVCGDSSSESGYGSSRNAEEGNNVPGNLPPFYSCIDKTRNFKAETLRLLQR